MAAAAADGMREPDLHLTRIVVRRPTRSAPAQLSEAISGTRSWLGPRVAPAIEGFDRHEADLKLRVGDRPTLVTFRKAAFIDIGPFAKLPGGWEVEIAWQASSFAPLFPVFSGWIVARPGELTLSGSYAPPGGAMGRAADRALLHIAAEGTARWLLRALDDAAAAKDAQE